MPGGLPQAGAAGGGAGHGPLAGYGGEDPRGTPPCDHCAGGEVHGIARCVSQRGGVPVPRRHRLRRGGVHPVGGLRDPDTGERGADAGRVRRRAGPRRLRGSGHRGDDFSGSICTGASGAVSGHLPGDADRRHRVCPPRGGLGRRPQRRIHRHDGPSRH